MTGADYLALGQYVAHLTVRKYRCDWEDMPLLTEAEFKAVDAAAHVAALQLAEQAGPRGRELWEAAQ